MLEQAPFEKLDSGKYKCVTCGEEVNAGDRQKHRVKHLKTGAAETE